MVQIILPYDASYSAWVKLVQLNLEKREIMYSDDMLMNICRSATLKVNEYLKARGFRVRDTIEYRRKLCKKLNKDGLILKIVSNDVLWKYLEYFTDVFDFKKCFDVSIEIIDINSIDKNKIQVVIESANPQIVYKATDVPDLYEDLMYKLFEISQYSTEYGFINDLLVVLELLIKRGEKNEKG